MQDCVQRASVWRLRRCLSGMGKTATSPQKPYADAKAGGESVSLATVYNTLRAFCDAGLMQEITVDGSKSYFDTNMDDHPHFFWEDERKLTDAPVDQLEIRRPPGPAGGGRDFQSGCGDPLRRSKHR